MIKICNNRRRNKAEIRADKERELTQTEQVEAEREELRCNR